MIVNNSRHAEHVSRPENCVLFSLPLIRASNLNAYNNKQQQHHLKANPVFIHTASVLNFHKFGFMCYLCSCAYVFLQHVIQPTFRLFDTHVILPFTEKEECICKHGPPQCDQWGKQVYCGRGGQRCARGYECKTDKADRYAVCCPKRELLLKPIYCSPKFQ